MQGLEEGGKKPREVFVFLSADDPMADRVVRESEEEEESEDSDDDDFVE